MNISIILLIISTLGICFFSWLILTLAESWQDAVFSKTMYYVNILAMVFIVLILGLSSVTAVYCMVRILTLVGNS